jgi:hypothetical protein
MFNEPADTPDVLQYKFFSSVCQIYLNAESFVMSYANSTDLPLVVWKWLLLVTNRSSAYVSGSNRNGETLVLYVQYNPYTD